MRWLLFLSRVALICNLFFIVCLILSYTHLNLPESLKSFIIITGYPMSFILNLVVNAAIIYLLIVRKTDVLHKKIALFNLFCLLFQIAYFFLF